MQDNPFCNYSLSCYQRPGVEPGLLYLQDKLGADVNMLLCCCWLGHQGLHITSKQLAHLQHETARWRAECILPLRAVRRFLKGHEKQAAYRAKVQALELQAEMEQQLMLFRLIEQMGTLPTDPDGTAAAMLGNLQCYLLNLPGLEWRDVADNVIEMLEALHNAGDE